MPQCTHPEGFAPVENYVYNSVLTRNKDQLESKNGSKGSGNASNSDKSNRGYRALLDIIRKRDDPVMLHKVLLALGSGATLGLITSNPSFHAHLTHLIMRLDPFTAPPCLTKTDQSNATIQQLSKFEASMKCFDDYRIADAHLRLCVAVVSANSTFLLPVLEMLVKFLCQEVDAPQERILRIHATLYTTLYLVPKGNQLLPPILSKLFPFKLATRKVIIWYVKQLITMLDYVPTILGDVLQICIEKCLIMDVEIKIHDGGGVSIEEDSDDENHIFEMDVSDENRHKKAVQNEEDDERKPEVRVDEMADKLDSVMLLLFEYLQSNFALPGQITRIYELIYPIFNTYIATTHKSKFVQFLLFYICGMYQEDATQLQLEHQDATYNMPIVTHEALYRDFASKLLDNVLDSRRSNVHRQISACYLASFVSRASYVNAETICECVAVFLRWAEVYINQTYANANSKNNRGDLSHSNALFYTVCQAAFYIMCFRGDEAWEYYKKVCAEYASAEKDSVVDADMVNPSSIDIGPTRWRNICCASKTYSQGRSTGTRSMGLHPLKYCLESVRREFLHLASVFELLPKDFIEESINEFSPQRRTTPKRSPARVINTAATMAVKTLEAKRSKGGVGGLGRGSNPLDSFFPFDPYLLRMSHVHVDPFYIYWEGSVVEDYETEVKEEEDIIDEMDDDFSKDENCDSDSEDDHTPQKQHMTQSLGSDHEVMMSISPASNSSTILTRGEAEATNIDDNDEEDHEDMKRGVNEQDVVWREEIVRFRKHSIAEGGSW